MLDAKNRQALVEKLRNKVKKASSNVSTKVEAQKGDFRVILTSKNIHQLYKDNEIGTIRVAELDDDVVEHINADAHDAAQDMLDAFASTFNVEEFEKSHKDNGHAKEAAHSTQDEGTWQMVTEKQFNDQKPNLHPRESDYYTNITQKQLPEHGQRPGTYDEITEAQHTNERTTFYGDERISGDRRQEDRNTVTEDQLEEGTKEYTELGESDRGESGGKYDGGLDLQWKQIGEKQLAELVKHHSWTAPNTVTEGKEQLGKQDGELSRITAEVAGQIIKEALGALGNTVLAAGVTPNDLAKLARQLVSHDSKYKVLADTIKRYEGSDISPIRDKVAKARYFGKVANVNQDWSDVLVADIFVRQLAKMAHHPSHIVDALVALAESEDFVGKIDEAVGHIITGQEAKIADESLNVFKQVLSGKTDTPTTEGDADDGLYEYKGTIAEVDSTFATNKNASKEEKDTFAKKAAEYARNQIATHVAKNADLVPQTLEVDEDSGTFVVRLEDSAAQKSDLKLRADKRRDMAKEAEKKTDTKEPQVKTAQTKEAQQPAGGMPPAAGPDMGNPAAPPGGGDMGAPPPGEALSQEPPLEEDMGATGEPKPPGSICPVDGSEDVDIDNGEFRCNSCGAEGTIHVKLDVTKWPETIMETGEDDKGFGIDEGIGAEESAEGGLQGGLGGDMSGGMGGGMGAGATMPNVPIGASVRITPLMLEKLAEQKITIGSVCPNCGGHNTDLAKVAGKKGKLGICWDCLQEYNFKVIASKNKKHNVYAQFLWQPMSSEACAGCNKVKEAFVTSLTNYGTTWKHFDKLNMKEQAELILKIAKAGALDIQDAMQEPLPIERFAASARWKGYEKFDKFPSASCMERLSRRFGENATAMSGPCQGEKLADCVCGQLENLGIYTDGLAAKVASVQASTDPTTNNPMESCVSMFVRDGYLVKDACQVCDGLRAAYASMEDLVIEAIIHSDTKTAQSISMGRPKPMAAPSDMRAKKTMAPTPGGPAKPMMAPGAPRAKPMMAPHAPMPAKPMAAPNVSPMPTKPMMAPQAPQPMQAPADPTAAKPMMAPESAPMPAPAAPMEAPGAPMPAPAAAPMPAPAAPMQAPGAPMPAPAAAPMQAPMDAGPAAMPEANPMDGMVDDGMGGMDGGMGGMDDGMGGMDDGMGGMDGGMGDDFGFGDEGDMDMGLEGDTVSIDIPQEAVDALKVFMDALQGQISDEFIETDEDALDTDEIEDTVVDDGSDEEGIPGVMNDDSDDGDNGDDDMVKEGLPGDEEKSMDEEPAPMEEESKPLGKPMNAHRAKTMEAKPAANPMKEKLMKEKSMTPVANADSEESVNKESSSEEAVETVSKEAQANELDTLLYRMKTGSFGSSASGLDNVFDGLMNQVKVAAKAENDIKKVQRKTATEGKIKVSPAQDTSDIGKVKDGGKIGHEESFSADKPDVPRAAATIGDEGSEVTISETGDAPSVPHGTSLMEGEEHYKPEKGNVVDGNQGGGPMTSAAESKKLIKEAKVKVQSALKDPEAFKAFADTLQKMRKTESDHKLVKKANASAKIYVVGRDKHPGLYSDLLAMAINNLMTVKLKDSNTYAMSSDRNDNVVLSQIIADVVKKTANCKCGKDDCNCDCGEKGCGKPCASAAESTTKVKTAEGSCKREGCEQGSCECGSGYCGSHCFKCKNAQTEEIKKESQTVTPKNVSKLEDDPDINQSSGPGKGKTHDDKAHSLGVDEKKPSEGMSEPSVPEAPNDGRLAREHTVEKAHDGPEIPAGGGMNPEYDKNEKNSPEKQDQMLGKTDSEVQAGNEEAIKIAGQMLKANLISIDDLNKTINKLSKADPEILEDYKKMITQASTNKGMKKAAQKGTVENPKIQTASLPPIAESDANLQQQIQSLFKLDARNKDHEAYSQDQGNAQLWR